MQAIGSQWISMVASPFVWFIVLFALTHMISRLYLYRLPPVMESGGLVMALAIIALFCLPRFDIPYTVMLILALELLVIWLYMGICLIQEYLRDAIPWHHSSVRYSLGTWVTSAILVVLLVDEIEPTLHGFIVFLGLIAVIICSLYLIIVLKAIKANLNKYTQLPRQGSVLLIAIATEALVVLFYELFRDDIPLYIYQILIDMGVFFYLWGSILVARYTFFARKKSWIVTWSNTNMYLCATLAMTGWAIMKTKVFSEFIVDLLWWLSIVSLIMILSIDMLRLVQRIKIKGIKQGIGIYSSSQWARIFTLGLVYAFTYQYYHNEYPTGDLVTVIANYGQYPLIALLFIELTIVLANILRVNRCHQEV